MSCIIITGSSRGIGFGLAKEFLNHGYNVVINGTTEKSVHHALNKLNNYKNKAIGFVGNVVSDSFASDLFDYALQSFGEVSIWINNAGINQPLKKAWLLNSDNIERLLQINLSAVIIATNEVFQLMEKQGSGKIFNMEGLGSDGRIIDNTALYGTSKRALNYYTKAFSKECKSSNIQVGIISPGMVITDFITLSIKEQTKEDADKAKKVFNMLGSTVGQITPFLVKGMLKTRKHYPRIEYLTNYRVFNKLIRYLFNERNYFVN